MMFKFEVKLFKDWIIIGVFIMYKYFFKDSSEVACSAKKWQETFFKTSSQSTLII